MNINIALVILNNIISYVPQFNYIIEGTLLENIALGNLDKKNIDIKKVEKLIDLLYLRDDLLKTRDEGINLFLGEKGINLSGGQIQRIGIARALYKDSKILLMDEPTSSLEPENEKRVANLICSMKDLTVIIVSHKKNTLNQCDEIYEFINGKLALFKKI
jgi:ATP-binding cassette subfamily B protein